MSRITQRGATAPLALHANGTFQSSNDANLATLVGSRWDLSSGGEVILVSVAAGASATAGLLYQDAALVTNHLNVAVTKFTAYSNNGNIPASVVLTIGATAMSANQYQGGYLVVNNGSGKGQTLRIASHPAYVASGTQGSIVLEDAPNVALSTNSTVSLIPPHGGNVITMPVTATNVPVGVGLYPFVPGSSQGFCFLKCQGIVNVLGDVSAPAIGAQVAASVATAGAVGTAVLSTATSSTLVGISQEAGVSGTYGSIFLQL